MILAISTRSWHYQYYLFIRRFWGVANIPARTSLCPYVQTIFWFTVGACVASPLLIAGWCALKCERLLFKLTAQWRPTLAKRFARSPIGSLFEHANEQFVDSPGAGLVLGLLATFFASVSTLGLAALLFLATAVLWAFVTRLGPHIPHALWFFFMVLAPHMVTVVWGFLAGFAAILISIVWHSLWIGALIAFIIGVLSRTKLWDMIIFRVNGYEEAASIIAKTPPPEPGWVRTNVWTPIRDTARAVRGFFSARLLGTRRIIAANDTLVLTAFGALWVFMRGLYKGFLCPFVEFVDTTPKEAP